MHSSVTLHCEGGLQEQLGLVYWKTHNSQSVDTHVNKGREMTLWVFERKAT